MAEWKEVDIEGLEDEHGDGMENDVSEVTGLKKDFFSRSRTYMLAGAVAAFVFVAIVLFCIIAVNIILIGEGEGEGVEVEDEGISPSVLLPDDPLERAEALMQRNIVVDTHNDLPWELRVKSSVRGHEFASFDLLSNLADTGLMTDIPRCREGGLSAQFWSVYVPCSVQNKTAVEWTLQQIDLVRRMVKQYPNDMQLALSSEEMEMAFNSGRIASLIGMEGGHSIHNSLSTLRQMYQLGARYMTLTHTCSTPWADSANAVEMGEGELSEFGESVVLEMNRLGMLVDISHVSDGVMRRVLDVSRAPVIFSHSSARHFSNHVRDVPDDVLIRLAENNGVIMINFYPPFVKESVRQYADSLYANENVSSEEQSDDDRRATLMDVANHFDYVKNMIGAEHLGFGADYDGIEFVTNGLEDVSTYKLLVAELIKRGWSDHELKGCDGAEHNARAGGGGAYGAFTTAMEPKGDSLLL